MKPPLLHHSQISIDSIPVQRKQKQNKAQAPLTAPPRSGSSIDRSMNKHGGGGGQAGDSQAYCSFHPREVVVGVCAHCLKDRLLLLLLAKDAKLGDDVFSRGPALIRRRTKSSSISLPKVFALGSSFLQRIDSRHHHHQSSYSDDDTSVASLDDSFISIKFEDNGKATWDKAADNGKSSCTAGSTNNNKAAAAAPARSSAVVVVAAADHAKRGGVTRWRKQVVGRLLQLARWKRSSAMDGNKKKTKERGRGWIRSLTRRRAHGDRAWS